MKTWQIGEGAGIASLECVERPLPEPGRGEVLVRVRAAALNHRDLMIVSGRYHGPKPATRVPLGDGMGEVVRWGDDVGGLSVGDRVSSVHFVRWLAGGFRGDVFEEDLGSTRDGWLSEYIVLPAAALVRVPDAIDDLSAAAIPAAGVTAWSVIHAFGQVRPGETVLTIGTGGVSMIAIQIARMAGARSVLLSSSAGKIAAAARAGVEADIAIDTSRVPDWSEAVREATGGGADIVVETVGTATLQRSIAACAVNGRIGLIGALGGTEPPRLDGLIARNVTIRGIASGSAEMLRVLLDAYAASGMRPAIGASFAFGNAPQAYATLAAAGHVGKICIGMSAADSHASS